MNKSVQNGFNMKNLLKCSYLTQKSFREALNNVNASEVRIFKRTLLAEHANNFLNVKLRASFKFVVNLIIREIKSSSKNISRRLSGFQRIITVLKVIKWSHNFEKCITVLDIVSGNLINSHDIFE